MASLIEAIREFGPHLELKSTIPMKLVTTWIELRTGMARSMAMMWASLLGEALQYHLAQGCPVKLDGIGTFSLTISREGKIKINFRPDPDLVKALNVEGGYTGVINNRRRIGLDDPGYKKLWDAHYPDNPLKINSKK
ncbi:MAG: hypothetical protein H6631_20055 [Anaerolineaceae bacterium]|nr:hypothetical protein [Anaerolineaceae bacterium]